MSLGVDPDDLAQCVSCGLCLPHCPTFRVTGDEARSPRGRISLMRAVEEGAITVDTEVVDSLATCVQCRGCEPACPSGVPFGRMIGAARESLAEDGKATPRAVRWGLGVLGHPRVLQALTVAGAVGQRLRLVPRRLALPALPFRRPRLAASGTDVYLHTGCVMDAWQRPVHLAVQQVIEATGATVALGRSEGVCCGALHEHAGLTDGWRRRAEVTMSAYPGDALILVDSAGCGAAMKEYGVRLNTPDAVAFSTRVRDVHEWLVDRLDALPVVTGWTEPVVVSDPCHLRHVQRAHLPVRQVLARFGPITEPDDDGLCCGAGGSYALVQPELAGAIRDRKVATLRDAGAGVVVSANPGCMIHLQLGGLDVRHPLELVAEAIRPRR